MASFYESLRDETAGPLISQFGLSAVLNKLSTSFNTATGVNTVSIVSATTVKVLQLPIERPRLRNIFREELVERASWQLIISAKELNVAGVTPGANDEVILSGKTLKITDILQIAPGGTVVVFKALVEG